MTVEGYAFTQKGRYDYKDTTTHIDYETIYALFLRDSSLIIEEQIKTPGMNGGYYYKTSATYCYKAYTNRHGQKYLKSFKKTVKGKIRPQSMGSLRQDPYLYNNAREFCPEMVGVIEKQFSTMLGFEFKRTRCPNNFGSGFSAVNSPEMLTFPFMRDPENNQFALELLADRAMGSIFGRGKYLQLTTEGSRSLTKALRECSTREELLAQIVYKSAVKGEEDVRHLRELPNRYLEVFHRIDLKMSVKEAVEAGYAGIFAKHDQIMSSGELMAFKYFLANLPKDKLGEVYSFLCRLDASRGKLEGIEKWVSSMENVSKTFSCYGHVAELDAVFKKITPADRQKFALLFWAEFQKAYLEAEKNCRVVEEERRNTGYTGNWSKKGPTVFSRVADAQMNAFAALYFSPEKAAAGIDRCVSTAKELFGVDLFKLGVTSITIPVKEGFSVALLDLTVPFKHHSSLSGTETDLFRLIQRDGEFFSLQNDLFQSQALDHLLAHLDSEHSLHNRFALASDLEKMLVKIAGYIDAGLAKVGEEITPDSRVLYLSAPVFDRKFKVNWRYYHRGVRPEDVPWFKRAKITTKKDIEFWLEAQRSLPDETYRELLADAGGGGDFKNLSGLPNFLSF